MNDYFKLRVELNLAQFPDDMVEETAHDVEKRIIAGESVTPNEIAWLIEGVARAEPKVHSATMTDGVRPRESF
jgi:hypothetical protein